MKSIHLKAFNDLYKAEPEEK